MNTLFIIGNGFDLAQGMKTSYKDFYPYYLKCDSPNYAVKKLKDSISKDLETWADLELELGKFTHEISDKKEFEELYFDLTDRLGDYLSEEIKNAVFDKKISSDVFLQYLFHPEECLPPRTKQRSIDFKRKLSEKSREINTINVISFNYTNTLERLLGYNAKKEIYKEASGGQSVLNGIYHVHGTLGDTILVGVNDESQVSNYSYKNDDSITDYLIKPNAITAMQSDLGEVGNKLIENADIILLFGVSLGDTDRRWWDAIINRMKNQFWNLLLVYFQFSNDQIPNTRRQLLGQKEKEARKHLYQRLQIPIEMQKEENILIGYNTNMFKRTDV